MTEEEVELWKASLERFLRKLTYSRRGSILLKSPPHTARVRLLLKAFPHARFIHIHRDPYAVFQSTRRLFAAIAPVWRLQRSNSTDDLDDYIIANYKNMYENFFEEWPEIPGGHSYDIKFEELELDPMGQIRSCYEALALPDFGYFESRLRGYLATIAGHEKVSRPELLGEPLRNKIATSLEQYFKIWNYCQ